MSWLQTLSETYDKAQENHAQEDQTPLLPISHSTQNAQIELIIDEQATCYGAKVVQDEETLIPVTEDSASRSGAAKFPHPLCDKLEYLTPHLDEYLKKKKGSAEKFAVYLEQLSAWCDSPYTDPKICVIREYLKRDTLLEDLFSYGVLKKEADGKLMLKWTGEKDEKPDIFKCTATPDAAFVRFRVTGTDSSVPAVWEDTALQEKFTNYYKSTLQEKGLCYGSGAEEALTEKHGKKLRNTGDSAKLISANDSSGFTFRGRFTTSEQAATVGYETSQKAHNALRWLVARQGAVYGTKTVLLFATNGMDMPHVMENTLNFACEDELPETAQEVGRRFANAFGGYGQQYALNPEDKFALLVLSAATTGRMSMNYYREFAGTQRLDLMKRVESWHLHCAWRQLFKNPSGQLVRYMGAPSPRDIANIAFGTEQGNFVKADAKVVGQTVLRLLPCISEGAKIPKDIVRACVRRATMPQNYSKNNWLRVLTTACSMEKKYLFDYDREMYQQIFDEEEIQKHSKEEWVMGLKTDCTDLSYTCGRLLAMGDYLERQTYSSEEKKGRTTNAMRYYTQFVQNPCRTWGLIQKKLAVYINKAPYGSDNFAVRMMNGIYNSIDPDAFAAARNLDGKMALGFGAQREFIYTKKETTETEKGE